MRHSRAKQFNTDWEYEEEKKKERKQTKELRCKRKSKRTQWELVE